MGPVGSSGIVWYHSFARTCLPGHSSCFRALRDLQIHKQCPTYSDTLNVLHSHYGLADLRSHDRIAPSHSETLRVTQIDRPCILYLFSALVLSCRPSSSNLRKLVPPKICPSVRLATSVYLFSSSHGSAFTFPKISLTLEQGLGLANMNPWFAPE